MDLEYSKRKEKFSQFIKKEIKDYEKTRFEFSKKRGYVLIPWISQGTETYKDIELNENEEKELFRNIAFKYENDSELYLLNIVKNILSIYYGDKQTYSNVFQTIIYTSNIFGFDFSEYYGRIISKYFQENFKQKYISTTTIDLENFNKIGTIGSLNIKIKTIPLGDNGLPIIADNILIAKNQTINTKIHTKAYEMLLSATKEIKERHPKTKITRSKVLLSMMLFCLDMYSNHDLDPMMGSVDFDLENNYFPWL